MEVIPAGSHFKYTTYVTLYSKHWCLCQKKKKKRSSEQQSSVIKEKLEYFLHLQNSLTAISLMQEMKTKHNMTVTNDTEDADMDHLPYNAAVVYHKLEFVLSNLKHFEEYSIEVSISLFFCGTACLLYGWPEKRFTKRKGLYLRHSVRPCPHM